MEVGPGPGQYLVKMDGSRRLSLRNRKFLRTFKGVADVMAEADRKIDQNRDPVIEQVVQGDAAEGVQVQEDHQQAAALPPEETGEAGPVQPSQQVNSPSRAETGDGRKYPRRERRRPDKLKDFEIEITG